MPDNHFDGWVASSYDAHEADMFSPAALDPMVEVLAEFAGAGGALEFAIGTGRVALPLAAQGVDVVGVELSDAMVEQLRGKPGGDAMTVAVGDMSTTRIDREFALVYLVFNTVMNLMTQDAQVACFENAARHLAPGGHFVVEVMVPDLRRLHPGERVVAFATDPTHLGFDEYDLATQAAASHHHYLEDGEWRAFTMPFRYVWPAELDLMARIAGLRFRDRWENWHRAPFTHESRSHVSIWQQPGG